MKTALAVVLREYDMVLHPGQSKTYAANNIPKSNLLKSGLERRRA